MNNKLIYEPHGDLSSDFLRSGKVNIRKDDTKSEIIGFCSH